MRATTLYFTAALFAATDRNAIAQSLELVAGGLGGSGSADATGADARFHSPQSVALDSMGNLYVADTNNFTIRKIVIASGAVSTVAGATGMAGSTDGTGSDARFSFPTGIAADCTGNLYVADSFNSTIRTVVIATGDVSTLAGTAGMTGGSDGTGAAARFNFPQGIAADCAGNVYVADTFNSTIRKIVVATREVTTVAGSAGEVGSADGPGPVARFNFPRGVASDGTGNLYVGDTDNFTIRQIDSMAMVTTIAGMPGVRNVTDGVGSAARFFGPAALANDGAGNLYVADSLASTIRRIDVVTQTVTTVAGTPNQIGSTDGVASDARFNLPEGVAADSMGDVYVADTNNATIRVIDSRNAVTTLVGMPAQSGTTDGTGAAARFHFPQGLWVRTNPSQLYIADTDSSTIRQIDISGGPAEVTTLAGAPNRNGSTDGVGANARFNSPTGVAWDSGKVYVADTENATIRKLDTFTREVTTLAGTAGMVGSTDGVGSAARFFMPFGIIADSVGDLYVSDTGNCTIRKIVVATREVTTVAGSAGQVGSVDGVGTAARFNSPSGVALDPAGNLYVADTGNSTIRKIDATTRAVTTIAGGTGQIGSTDGIGTAARFNSPESVAADRFGNLYIADTFNSTIRKLDLASGEVTTLVGTPGIGKIQLGPLPAGLAFPTALIVTQFNQLMISDSGENVILEIRSLTTAPTRNWLLREPIKKAWNLLKGALRPMAFGPQPRAADDKTLEVTERLDSVVGELIPDDEQLWSAPAPACPQSNPDDAAACSANWFRCVDDKNEAYKREAQRCQEMILNPIGAWLCLRHAVRNRDTDIVNCKAQVCPAGQDCHLVGAVDSICCNTSAAACSGPVCCPQGQTCCGGGCVNLLFDRYNCGSCGRACPDPCGQCINGQCHDTVECGIGCCGLGGRCCTCDFVPPACISSSCDTCVGVNCVCREAGF